MTLTQHFTEQLEREVPLSNRALERVPEGKTEWKPHEKSMPLGYLAALVAMIPEWVANAIEMNELDIAGGGKDFPMPRTSQDLVAFHERSAAKARAALAATNDAFLQTPWRLLVGGKVVMEKPRGVVITDSLMHMAHHRGQLTVYLRLLGQPVPAIYGPSADDQRF
jgi:uncharacterized damage-inducible protein DinB